MSRKPDIFLSEFKVKNKAVKVLAVLMILAVVAGCQTTPAAAPQPEENAAAASYPLTFTDALDREITLSQAPQRPAVLFSSYAELWQLAGGDVAVTVGDSVKRGFVNAETPLVDDGAGLKIDAEQLIAQQPDFVIASADMGAQAELCGQLSGYGIPCAALKEESFADYLSLLKLFTQITGNTEAYKTYGLNVQQEIETLLAEVTQARWGQEPILVLFIRAGSGYSATKAKTAKDHFVGGMLEELGAVNIADEAGALSEGLALESILLNQPDVILIVPQGNEEAARAYMDSLLQESGWRDLEAVKNGRCTYLSKDLFHYKPNARWAEAYRVLAGLLYPESFS